MPNLTHNPPRPSRPPGKLLLVRQPVKSVRRGDHADPMPLRLALGVIVALGVLLAVWLIGHVGFRLGFAPIVRVPELTGEPGADLAAGTRVLIEVPRVIFRAGLAEPFWLMLAFAMIALPAAGLAAARPRTPGGPRQEPAIAAIAASGAIAAMLNGAALIWWTGSAMRTGLIRMLPLDPAAAPAWYADLQIAAGLDVLAVVAAALWVVLVMRLPVALWLRSIAATTAFFSLVVVLVAMSISTVTATQTGARRSLCQVDDLSGPRSVLLGSTPHHLVLLTAYDDDALIQLRSQRESLTVMGEESIVGYLEQAVE
ncbi:MAG: hypothetical protein GY715_16125 [Planctomycetes bacterium]|nr:hypothetical protein [Planctomycetota bacterium]